jgi:hypothetical protein
MRDAPINPEKIGDVVSQDKNENEKQYSPRDPYRSDKKNEK